MEARQPTLTDQHVVLTAWSLRDAPTLVIANRDPEMAMRFDFPPDPPRIADARRAIRLWQRNWRTRKIIAFAVRDPRSSEAIGGAELRPRDGAIANVSYFTLPERRGQGVATRAVRLLSTFAIRELGIERLEIKVDRDNLASQRVATSAGFVREGTLRSYEPTQRGRLDMVLYSLLPSDLPRATWRLGDQI
jgi:ribosomal-protein-alanine N-acetyltransferase